MKNKEKFNFSFFLEGRRQTNNNNGGNDDDDNKQTFFLARFVFCVCLPIELCELILFAQHVGIYIWYVVFWLQILKRYERWLRKKLIFSLKISKREVHLKRGTFHLFSFWFSFYNNRFMSALKVCLFSMCSVCVTMRVEYENFHYTEISPRKSFQN